MGNRDGGGAAARAARCPGGGDLRGSCAASVLAATPAQAATDEPIFESDLYTVITGVVRNGGNAVSGANVLLLAWPNDDLLDELGEGDQVSNLVAGRATTDAQGGFAVSVDPASIPAEYRPDLGHVDFELHVAVDDSEVMWNFSAGGAESLTVGTAWGNPRVEAETSPAESGVGPAHITIDLTGDAASLVELGNEPSTWENEDGAILSDEEAREAAHVELVPHPAGLDAATEIGTMAGPLWCATNTYTTRLAQQFIRSVGTLQGRPYTHQSTSSSHTMGVAVKSSGGKWSTGGTRTKSTSASADNIMGYSVLVRNRVNYRKYAGCEVITDQWRPDSFYSLNDHIVIAPRPQSWTHCSNTVYRSGSNSKTQGSNATYSAGVEFPYIKLSSNAKFTSNTKMRWSFNDTGARLCGSTSKGWAEAPQAGAYIPSWP